MTELLVSEQDPTARDAGEANNEQPVVTGAAEDAELTPEQLTVLAALVDNPDIQSAADAAGVNRATVYRWMKKPTFHEELTRQRNQIFAAALAAVKTHAWRAVTQLAGLLDAADDRVRRQVCNDILAQGLKVHNMQDLDERIKVLEKNMKQQKNAQRGINA